METFHKTKHLLSNTMLKIIDHPPSVKNCTLFSDYIKTVSVHDVPDTHLLRYASNIWYLRLSSNIFHPELNAIRLSIPFGNNIIMDIPYMSLSSLGINTLTDPSLNTISLDIPCHLYCLAEEIIISLPYMTPLHNLYPQLISSDDGLNFIIPYTNMINHKITDNLTKLSISLSQSQSQSQFNYHSNYELFLYPQQKSTSQPLSSGLFQPFSNLSPFQALQVVNDSIDQGIQLSNSLSNYYTSLNSQKIRNRSFPPLSADSLDPSIDSFTLSHSGQADDLNYNFASSTSDLKLDTYGSLPDYNNNNIQNNNKRLRRESNDIIPISTKKLNS